jgi:hypothetical protein
MLQVVMIQMDYELFWPQVMLLCLKLMREARDHVVMQPARKDTNSRKAK